MTRGRIPGWLATVVAIAILAWRVHGQLEARDLRAHGEATSGTVHDYSRTQFAVEFIADGQPQRAWQDFEGSGPWNGDVVQVWYDQEDPTRVTTSASAGGSILGLLIDALLVGWIVVYGVFVWQRPRR